MDNELKDLVNKLYDAENASRVIDDIEKGDSIIASYISPKPNPKVVKKVKMQLSDKLRHRSARRVKHISLQTALAAILAITAFLGLRSMIHRNSTAPISKSNQEISWFWGNNASAAENAAFLIRHELDDIEMTIQGHRIGFEGINSQLNIDDLELEINKIQSGFWSQ